MGRRSFDVLSFVLLTFGLVQQAQAQTVLPNGATTTTAATALNGKITVNIAPANGRGISINQYTNFSVPETGVDLNNRSVGANMIVNDVRGTSRSLLNGPLAVLGTRAHLVLINPNGVTVDGGSFINVGGVALGAGSLSYAPGGNPILNTGTGDILVTGKGLAGAMTSLQMVAAKLKIDGSVRNSHAAPEAEIALVAGNHEVELDASLQAGSTLRNWASTRDLGGSSGETLVDVTSLGSLEASRVRIAVSARGAGVAFAGRGQASVGGFSISANGKVSVQGAQIRAEKAVRLAGTSVEILNAPTQQANIESLSGAITVLASAGNIDLHGALNGKVRDSEDVTSQGGVTLKASGDINLWTQSAERIALAFASGDDLVVEAGGTLTNNHGRLLSNANTRVVASSVHNINEIVGADSAGVAQVSVKRGRRFWQSLWFKRKRTLTVTQSFGQLRIADANLIASITGNNVVITAANELVNSGQITTLYEGGSILIDAGSVQNLALRAGSLRYEKRCGLICRSAGVSNFVTYGGHITAAQNISITAQNMLLNWGGEITALGNLALSAPQIIGRGQFLPTIYVRPPGLGAVFAGSYAWQAIQPQGGYFTAGGEINVNSITPIELEGGNLVATIRVDNQAGLRIIPLPTSFSPIGQHRIGLFAGWLR